MDNPEDMVILARNGVCSPIIPVSTPQVKKLADYLRERGYAVTALPAPIAKTSRIRVSIHAGNTEEEIDAFANELLAWAERQRAPLYKGGAIGSARVGESFVEARAKL